MRGAEDGVVLHVLADAGEVVDAGDVEFGELLAGSDARDHQQLGRLQGACRDDDFPASSEGEVERCGAERALRRDLHARGSLVCIEQDLLRQGVLVHHGPRATVERVAQEAGFRGRPVRVPRVDGERRIRRAHESAAVEAIDLAHAHGNERPPSPGPKGIDGIAEGHLQGTTRGAECIRGLVVGGIGVEILVRRRIATRLLIVRQHAIKGIALVIHLIRPSLHTIHRGPVIQHEIPRRRTAQRLPTHIMHHAIPRPRLRLRAEPPVNQRVVRVGLRPRELGRVSGHDGVIAIVDLVEPAGLDDRDAGGAVLRETAGDGQAGISTTDDDVVEGRIGSWNAERGA